jgi:hypothetical protein
MGGTLPILGELDEDLCFLGRRINISTNAFGATNLEQIHLPLTGVKYTFAEGGKTEIDMNYEPSQILREGV